MRSKKVIESYLKIARGMYKKNKEPNTLIFLRTLEFVLGKDPFKLTGGNLKLEGER
jgi:hypothetical protein